MSLATRFRALPLWLRSAALLLGVVGGVALFFFALSAGLRFFPEPIGSRAELFSEGARVTLMLTVLAGTLGLFVGLLLSLSCISRFRLLRLPAQGVIWVLRGTPLMVQILFAYFALPGLLPWLKLDDFSAAMLALAFNVGAYNSEVIRAGIQAVPRGQEEAAFALGLSRAQTMVFVILPQAVRIVIPPLVNNVVALLKDSSLASAIGLLELALAGNRVSSETFQPIPTLTTVAVIYLLLTTALTAVTRTFERLLALPVSRGPRRRP
jgi:polar amino acid transport system permease protein